MIVVVELVNGVSIRGWAVNFQNFAERLTVQTWINGRFYLETTANLFRADLLGNNVGDGAFGFEQPITSDMYFNDRGEAFSLEVRGFLEDGTPVETNFLSDALSAVKSRVAIPELAVTTPNIFGDGFFCDNIRAHNRVLDLSDDFYAAERCKKSIISVRMYGFGDFMWWDDPETATGPSAAKFLSHIGPQTKERLANGSAKLMFDMSNEGPTAMPCSYWLQLLHQELYERGINPSSCVMVNHNAMYDKDYAAWCQSAGQTDAMDVLHYDFYLAKFAHLTSDMPQEGLRLEPSIEETESYRAFVCLNFTPRQDRLSFLAWLFGAELSEHGFISFAGFANHKMDGSDFSVPEWFPEPAAVRDGIDQLKTLGRLTLDLPEENGRRTPEFDLGPQHCFHTSFFSIVTESDFSDGEVRRITEKCLKPLAMGHPIIVVGNPYSLQRLRELGFRTFAPFIDESYDTCEDRFERMTLVQAEVRRLATMPKAELVQLRVNLRRVIEHNYRHARGGLADLYRSVIEPGFLDALDGLSWESAAP